ncbi:sigma-70 family RNA polymerase sigma factor [Chitinophaga nivalis]|uniref:Sigma-70 family RNA polymerase sigma factor n=1 Tax=Chitinophaga nivalis TaxID=2991709 RepID=A0ABT3IWW9_9BACT|nr:sigma-70 family RNA polymerase sigma factor [Chitinophaga nivalis]MCW3462109.1 sigma-70 family RNA polymerase sigma factor [Chitinophaga nivalis]MCW3488199.1 sigma-70 family RNA polymerase sigma factor [Chitinophaga nivalis]
MKHITDPELLLLLREDDERAFREIYERYWKTLYQQAVKKLATTEEVRDIVQEIFFSLWKSRHTLVLRETLLQYLYTSLRYKIIDYYRLRTVRSRYYSSLLQEEEGLQPEINDQLYYRQLNTLVEEEIRHMPAKMQEVFVLSRDHNLNAVEIAHKLSLSHQTVRNQISTALKRIRKRLDNTL